MTHEGLKGGHAVTEFRRLVVLLLVISFSWPSFGHLDPVPANGPTTGRGKLEILIVADRTNVDLGESIELTAVLQNFSGSPVTIYANLMWGYFGGLVLRVRNVTTGEFVVPRFNDDSIVPPHLAREPRFYLALQSDHSLGVTRLDPVSDLFRTQGVYEVQVVYRCPLPPRSMPSITFWSSEMGALTSKPIRVTVTANDP